jgi:hypothetical protein
MPFAQKPLSSALSLLGELFTLKKNLRGGSSMSLLVLASANRQTSAGKKRLFFAFVTI